MAILMLGALLLVGCDEIEDPVDSCVISSKFKKAECGKRDLNFKHRTIGDFLGETKLEDISFADNYVCFSGKHWSDIIKPALKEVNTKYRQKKRKRK